MFCRDFLFSSGQRVTAWHTGIVIHGTILTTVHDSSRFPGMNGNTCLARHGHIRTFTFISQQDIDMTICLTANTLTDKMTYHPAKKSVAGIRIWQNSFGTPLALI